MKDKNEEFKHDEATDLNENFVKDGAKGITKEDLKKVAEKLQDIEDKVFKNSAFKKIRTETTILFNMIKDYVSGKYTEIPWYAIAAIVFALLYVLSPVDLVPDIIPFIGYLDDAAVVAACVRLIRNEIDVYQTWKKSQNTK